MQIDGRMHISGQRITKLCIEADSFSEEKMLACIVQAIQSGGRIEITEGKNENFEPETMVFEFSAREAGN